MYEYNKHLPYFNRSFSVSMQLLAELGAFSASPKPPPWPPSAPLLQSLRQFHYLDAGLNCRGAYLTHPEVFSQLGRWCEQHKEVSVHLHGTPRQWSKFMGKKPHPIFLYFTRAANEFRV